MQNFKYHITDSSSNLRSEYVKYKFYLSKFSSMWYLYSIMQFNKNIELYTMNAIVMINITTLNVIFTFLPAILF
jgi:hypothetical protein